MLSVMGSTPINYLVLLPFVSMFYCVVLKGQELPTPLVYGGNLVNIVDAPFMAIFRNIDQIIHCGAAIVHSKLLLSAAHCDLKSGRVVVIVGTDIYNPYLKPEPGEYYDIKRVVNHPNYKDDEFPDDLCVIVLARVLVFSDKVKPIPMALDTWDSNLMPKELESMFVYGFGITDAKTMLMSDELRMAAVKYIPRIACEDILWMENQSLTLPYSNICSWGDQGRGACEGDSGGPLVYKGHLLGIVNAASDNFCTGKDFLSSYVHVYSVRDFIKRVMAQEWETQCKYKVRGGYPVPIAQAPFIASFKLEDKRYTCAATIVHEQFLVSTAHCLQTAALMESQVTIKVGHVRNDGDGHLYLVEKIFIHPKFNVKDNDYDLAVIKLVDKLAFNSKVAKVTVSADMKEPAHGSSLFMYGFAEKSDSGYAQIHELNLPYYSWSSCKSLYASDTSYTITKQQICAGAKGNYNTCGGDGGGPIFYRRAVLGIASWGLASCQLGYPTVFTYLPPLKPYIDEVIKNNTL